MLLNNDFPRKVPVATDTVSGSDASGAAKSYLISDLANTVGGILPPPPAGGITGVTGTTPIVVTAGAVPNVSLDSVALEATLSGKYLELAGGTMSGDINMGGALIHNCGGFFEGPGGGVPPGVGTVTLVTGVAPIIVTNGTTTP